MKSCILSASLQCADVLHLEKDLAELKAAGVEYLHIDAADGHFVPNLGVGMDFTKKVAAATDMPLDVHLMVSNPDFWVPKVIEELSPAIVCWHHEATNHSVRLAQAVRASGAKAGVCINPGTPVHMLECVIPEVDMVMLMTVNPGFAGQKIVESTLRKIEIVADMAEGLEADIDIAVDGNVSFTSGPQMRELGANMFICGTSSLWLPGHSIVENASAFREALAAAE